MSNDQPIPLKPRPAGDAPAPNPPNNQEDTGTQALSEALQSSFLLVKIVMVVLVIVFLGSGFFTVKQGEQAVKLRFGRPVGGLLGPGAHWAFPAPIDEVTKVSMGNLLEASSTIGMPMDTSSGKFEDIPKTSRDRLTPGADGYTLTGDANIIHARAAISYTISQPERFIFDFTSAKQFVTNALDNALLYASSQFTVDEVLTTKRAAFSDCVERRVHQLIDQQQLGITVGQVTALPYAPAKLKDTFEGVSAAYANKQQSNNLAMTYQNETVTTARARAVARTNAALVASESYVNAARVEAKNFCDLLDKFEKSPQFYSNYCDLQRSEVVGRVVANAKERMFVPQRTDGMRQLRVLLNREPEKPLPAAPAD